MFFGCYSAVLCRVSSPSGIALNWLLFEWGGGPLSYCIVTSGRKFIVVGELELDPENC